MTMEIETTGSAPTSARPGPTPFEVHAALHQLLDGEVLVDDYTRHLYASDASMYAIEPFAVVLPRHATDVAVVVRVAAQLGIPVLPRGAGTSLAGQTVGRAIVLDFSRYMNRVIAVDSDALTARVQPGVVQDELNRTVAPLGLMFGPDTSTSNRATIGGMIGNNSAGSHSIRYGSTIDHVESLQVVLADGSITEFGAGPASASPPAAATDDFAARIAVGVNRVLTENRDELDGLPPFWRHSGGYRLDRLKDGHPSELHKLIVGSEGTLALVTEATVRLVPRPRATAFAVGQFDSALAAVAATQDALAMNPFSVELIDHRILDLARQRAEHGDLAEVLTGEPGALLFVEFAGESAQEVGSSVDELAATWAAHNHGYDTIRAVRASDQAAMLRVRKASLGLLMAASEGSRRPLAFIEDTAVPPEVLVNYLSEFSDILDRHKMVAGFYGHCSVGCLHIRPFVDVSNPAEAEAMTLVADEISDLVMRYGGVNSSEHGDGLARSWLNRKLFGDRLYEAMRETKQVFDPGGVLNPGKIVDAPAMTANLRDAVAPAARPVPFTPRMSFVKFGGMLETADRCMNIGQCRKQGVGTMCPSFMATRKEEDSTRGRANALVKALSSPVPRDELASERMHEVLDLCLECKACKTECPLGVDMATLKTEALYQYQSVHGTPLRSQVFSHINTLNRLGARFGPLTNWMLRRSGVRRTLAKAIGIAEQRELPALHRNPAVTRRFLRNAAAAAPGPRGDVLLLTDSFTTYSEPAISAAAVELLQLAGYRVIPTGLGCCGRSSLSKGMVDQAQRLARSLMDSLAPAAERGVPIVGIEPSCLLTIADDYGALLPGDPRVAAVAERTVLLPQILGEAIDNGWLTLRATEEFAGTRIVFHGHCHEKAIVGTAESVALLRRIPGAQVAEIDSGCCGMAGSFGYEAEHYELSMQIGRERLFPALDAEPEATLIAATGTSCRTQIAHGVGRPAAHPAELILRAVDKKETSR